MKRLLFLLFISFSVQIGAQQTYKIVKTAAGEMDNVIVLYEPNGEDIFGYVEFIRLDKLEKKMYKFQYTLLDKNLNRISSGEFLQRTYYQRSKPSVQKAVYLDGYLMLLVTELKKVSGGHGKIWTPILNFYKIINLNDNNKLIDDVILEDDVELVNGEIKKKKALNYMGAGSNLQTIITPIEKTGFLLRKLYFQYGVFQNTYELIGFDGKIIWNFREELLTMKDYKDKEKRMLSKAVAHDDKYIYFYRRTTFINMYKKFKEKQLVARDIKTGKVVNKLAFQDEKHNFIYFYGKKLGDKLYLLGKYNDGKANPAKNILGFARWEFDLSGDQLKTIGPKYIAYDQIKYTGKKAKKISLKKYFLGDFYIDSDANTYIAGNDYYKKGAYNIILDNNFNPVKTKLILGKYIKDPLYNFYQKLLNDKGMAFVYTQKESMTKQSIHILKVYFNNFDMELNRMENNLRNSVITVHPAKKGYILIEEMFKKTKQRKDKYIELRLEKID